MFPLSSASWLALVITLASALMTAAALPGPYGRLDELLFPLKVLFGQGDHQYLGSLDEKVDGDGSPLPV